jgi:N-acetylmuramoyl-L-alanine amidase
LKPNAVAALSAGDVSDTPLVEQRPSPNHGARAVGKPVDILLLHYTGMPSEQGALDWLCNPMSEVSAHYFVHEDGRIVQMVEEHRRAWHAGQSFWAGESDINSRSIGIEIANPGPEDGPHPFPDDQIAAVIGLSRGILARHPIPPERVLAHSDVAPHRKQDPGGLFPWDRLKLSGVGHWVPAALVREGERDIEAAPLTPDEIIKRFRRYGYGLGEAGFSGLDLTSVVTAFQRHFRPARIDGIADWSTIDTLDRLLAAHEA